MEQIIMHIKKWDNWYQCFSEHMAFRM